MMTGHRSTLSRVLEPEPSPEGSREAEEAWETRTLSQCPGREQKEAIAIGATAALQAQVGAAT